MKLTYSISLNDNDIKLFSEAIEKINSYMVPSQNTGDLLVCYRTDGKWKSLISIALDDSGNGKYHLMNRDKAKHLMNLEKDGINFTTSSAMLFKDCKKSNNTELENSNWDGSIIVTFSGRKDWQNIFYCISAIKVLEKILDINIILPEKLRNDPLWGTVINYLHGM